MTFLPIVGRELRVAARKRSTFWVRVTAAIVALVIGIAFMVLASVAFGIRTASLGKGLFATLTWLSLVSVLCAGLFFTSDCLSEEKREGTLGFLFLTDLTGYDVVLGKLWATSLRAFYALLAIFPILAVTLLMGGVTGAQFWKTILALVNALFLSLAAGLFVSALSRDSQKALAWTLMLLSLLAFGGPATDALLAWLNDRRFNAFLSLSSPGYLFVIAAWAKQPFWLGLLVNQLIAWGLLGLACVLLPRTWQEKSSRDSAGGGSLARWKFGGAKRRAAIRRKLVALNPVLWLACRERWQAVVLWMFSLLALGTTVAILARTDERSGAWMVWSYLGGLVTLGVYLGITSHACRFLVDARRSGLLELLLATPLTAVQIVQGQWRAVLRMFGLPLAIYLAAQLVAAVMASLTMSSLVAGTPAPAPAPAATNGSTTATTNTTVTTVIGPGGVALDTPNTFVTVAVSLAATLTSAANFVALVWFGMWMGLTSRNVNLATLKTILFVQIIPWFAVSFAAGMLMPLLLMPGIFSGTAANPAQMMVWFPLITSALTTVLFLGKDVVFVVWSRNRLHADFRSHAAPGMMPVHALPPVLPNPANPTCAVTR